MPTQRRLTLLRGAASTGPDHMTTAQPTTRQESVEAAAADEEAVCEGVAAAVAAGVLAAGLGGEAVPAVAAAAAVVAEVEGEARQGGADGERFSACCVVDAAAYGCAKLCGRC